MGEFIRDRLPDPTSYFEDQGLKLHGRGKWRTTGCAFHGGSDSMRINVETGGWVCMACGERGGDVLAYQMRLHDQEFVDAARELGAYLDDGRSHRGSDSPAGLSARASLQVLASESNLAAVAACNLAHGTELTDDDRQRLLVAAARIRMLAEAE